MELAPPMAVVIRGGEPVEVPPPTWCRGSAFDPTGGEDRGGRRRRGGASEVDESMVTGESLPVSKAPATPSSEPRSTPPERCGCARPKVGSDTVLAQIVEMVQEAQNSKAPGQRLADRAAFWLVLVALIGGAMTFLVWWAVGAGVQAALLLPSPWWSSLARMRSVWRRRRRSWSAPVWAPNAVCCSKVLRLWRFQRGSRPW